MPFKLSLDIDEDSEEPMTDFELRKKQLYDYDKKFFEKSKSCAVFDDDKKALGQGGFGETRIVGNKIYKIIGHFTKKYLGTQKQNEWDWIFNRYKNFCNDMKQYTSKTHKLFPENFILYKDGDCGKCLIKKDFTDFSNPETHLSIYVNMDLVKNAYPGDFNKNVKQKKFTDTQLNLIIAQVYYICMKTNMKSLHHNDLKLANIIIKKSNKDFTYNNLTKNGKTLTLKIKKGDPVPVFIDYDLVSFVNFDELNMLDFPANHSSSNDFLYFKDSFNKVYKKLPLLSLPEESKKYNPELTFKMFIENGLENRVKLSQTGGKKTTKKSKKNIRKHQGINQRTGKLKNGYKYSDKKLKSGLLKIIKEKK